jgi:hypothetical protein
VTSLQRLVVVWPRQVGSCASAGSTLLHASSYRGLSLPASRIADKAGRVCSRQHVSTRCIALPAAPVAEDASFALAQARCSDCSVFDLTALDLSINLRCQIAGLFLVSCAMFEARLLFLLLLYGALAEH